ncbi:MAG: hypothetical protein ACE5LL_04740 [Alphaproteobacteria bacterium]
MPETAARLLLAAVAPKETRQLVARTRLARRQRQIGEQRLGLLRRQGDGRPRPKPGLEAAEESEL